MCRRDPQGYYLPSGDENEMRSLDDPRYPTLSHLVAGLCLHHVSCLEEKWPSEFRFGAGLSRTGARSPARSTRCKRHGSGWIRTLRARSPSRKVRIARFQYLACRICSPADCTCVVCRGEITAGRAATERGGDAAADGRLLAALRQQVPAHTARHPLGQAGATRAALVGCTQANPD
jgi:hypothetical protein